VHFVGLYCTIPKTCFGLFDLPLLSSCIVYIKGKKFRAVNTIRTKWAEHDARIGENTNAYTISLGRHERKRQIST